MDTSNAVILVDFIEEIIGTEGKLAAKGYRSFADEYGTLAAAAGLCRRARDEGEAVIHVRLGFAVNYWDHPSRSPLFGAANGLGILQVDTPSTDIVEEVKPAGNDLVLTKKRVSPFYGTGLELTLRTLGIRSVTLAGVSTDLAIQSAARDAHDRDFSVTVASAACAAACIDDHERALANLAKIATIA